MRHVTIALYSFTELSKEAQKEAISQHWTFLDSTPVESEKENGEMEEVYEENTEASVIENILINEYIYFEDGELANCTTYTGKHPKAGKTEFKFHGSVYDITNETPAPLQHGEKVRLRSDHNVGQTVDINSDRTAEVWAEIWERIPAPELASSVKQAQETVEELRTSLLRKLNSKQTRLLGELITFLYSDKLTKL